MKRSINEYQEALDKIKSALEQSDISAHYWLELEPSLKLMQEVINNDEFKTIYGFPIEQVIIWGVMVAETKMTSKELKDKTDLIGLGYKMAQEDFLKNIKVTFEIKENNETHD
jgi:predicted membrane-bound dolichyl-phosphate-mannose-protein mannosyltransferase